MPITPISKSGIPMIGIGTYQIIDKIDCRNSIKCMLLYGYSHIDTASVYKNEEQIGDIVKELNVAREKIYIVSKLGPNDYGTEIDVYNAAIKSLKSLNMEYFDCYLLHWPGKSKVPINSPLNKEYRRTAWRAIERLVNEGKTKNIGVSNFTVSHLSELLSYCRIRPICNQVEFHPLCTQPELLPYCVKEGVQLVAYSSLGQSKGKDLVLNNPVVAEIAKEYGKSNAQILLRWAVQQGVPVIPKSITPSRIEENIKIFDFELSSETMQKLSSLNENKHFAWDPTNLL